MVNDEERDEILRKVAKEIYGDDFIMELGKELRFIPAKVSRFIESNYNPVSSSNGTLRMLREWNEGILNNVFTHELRKIPGTCRITKDCGILCSI